MYSVDRNFDLISIVLKDTLLDFSTSYLSMGVYTIRNDDETNILCICLCISSLTSCLEVHPGICRRASGSMSEVCSYALHNSAPRFLTRHSTLLGPLVH